MKTLPVPAPKKSPSPTKEPVTQCIDDTFAELETVHDAYNVDDSTVEEIPSGDDLTVELTIVFAPRNAHYPIVFVL